jgi:hypothetical protein
MRTNQAVPIGLALVVATAQQLLALIQGCLKLSCQSPQLIRHCMISGNTVRGAVATPVATRLLAAPAALLAPQLTSQLVRYTDQV